MKRKLKQIYKHSLRKLKLTTERQIDCKDLIGSTGGSAVDEFKVAVKTIAEIVSNKKTNIYHENAMSTGKLMAREFVKLGYEVDYSGKMGIVKGCDKRLLFLETETSQTSLLGYRILKNKNRAREFFKKADVSVARGKIFKRSKEKEARAFALKYAPAVIKPIGGNKGRGVTVGVKTEQEFSGAWNNAVRISNQGVLVEEQFKNGVEARYLVVGGKCAAVVLMIPPHVIGNGVDTVSRLIEKKNERRLNHPLLDNKLIELNNYRLEVIKKQGFELSSILPEYFVVIIDLKAGISTGADSVDITDEVHPSFKQIAERVAAVVPGLDVIGVDILAHDHTRPPQKDNYIVIEANTRPGISAHHYPVFGEPRNAAAKIVEHMLKSAP